MMLAISTKAGLIVESFPQNKKEKGHEVTNIYEAVDVLLYV